MKCIPRRISRHDVAGNIGTDDIHDGRFNCQERQVLDQFEALLAAGVLSAFELIYNRRTCDKLVPALRESPPLARPFLASHHFRLAAHLVVETRDAGFDIHGSHHGMIIVPRLQTDARGNERTDRGCLGCGLVKCTLARYAKDRRFAFS